MCLGAYYILAAFAAICLAADIDPPVKAATIACATEYGIKDSLLEKLLNSVSTDPFWRSKREYKCFVKCLNDKLGVINDKGELIADVFNKYYVIENAPAKYKKCYSENTHSDPCEMYFNIQLCLIKD